MHLKRQRTAQHRCVQRVSANASWAPHPLVCSATQAPQAPAGASAAHHLACLLSARWPPAGLQHPELCCGLLQCPLELGVVVAHCSQVLSQQVCLPPQRLCIRSHVAQAAGSCLLALLGVLHSTAYGLRCICHAVAGSIQGPALLSLTEHQLQTPPTACSAQCLAPGAAQHYCERGQQADDSQAAYCMGHGCCGLGPS